MPQQHSFTVRSQGGILRALQTSCGIAEAFDPVGTPAAQHPQFKQFQAIWDTGATGSVITQNVVDACTLKPISMTQVHGVDSSNLSEVYLVNIMLPNNVGVRQVRVSKNRLINTDVLIGMDIITLGDFAVTHQGGNTVFSFCFPSQRCLDFVAEGQRSARANQPGFRGYTQPKQPKRHK